MDNIVDALNTSYQDFVGAIADLFEAKSDSDAALENLKLRWKLYRVACDQAVGFVESLKLRIGSECLINEATGSVVGNSGQTGVQPISAVRLEQMSKTVGLVVIDLQHGSESVGNLSM